MENNSNYDDLIDILATWKMDITDNYSYLAGYQFDVTNFVTKTCNELRYKLNMSTSEIVKLNIDLINLSQVALRGKYFSIPMGMCFGAACL